MRFCLEDWEGEPRLEIDCAVVTLVGGVVSLLPTLDAEEVVVGRLKVAGFALTDEFSRRYGGKDFHLDFLLQGDPHDPLELRGQDDEGLAAATQIGVVSTGTGFVDLLDVDAARNVCRFEPDRGWHQDGQALGGVIEIAPASYFWAALEPAALGRRQRLSALAV